jgi:hypothetical protein
MPIPVELLENAKQRYKVDVVVTKSIKDMQHRPSPNGEG